MNRIITVLICAAGLSFLSSCAGSGAAKGGAVWSDVQGKEWILSTFTGTSGAVAIDRTKNAGMGELFLLNSRPTV